MIEVKRGEALGSASHCFTPIICGRRKGGGDENEPEEEEQLMTSLDDL
jgi:hypothetical protein